MFFVGFAIRPVGAVIFGHFGDRFGRKATLVATLLLMGVSTVLIGLVPTYDQIGVWGAVAITTCGPCRVLAWAASGVGAVAVATEWGTATHFSIFATGIHRRHAVTHCEKR